MIYNATHISEDLQPERLRLPNNAHLIDNTLPATPQNLRQLYPNESRIFVLDLPVLFTDEDIAEGKIKQIEGPEGTILGLIDDSSSPVIINIDHHSKHVGFEQNISTVHQVLTYQRKFRDLNLQNSPIVVNHTDTDSLLSVLIMFNPDIPIDLKLAFSHAVLAADHTGEFNELVTLIDAVDERNLEFSLKNVIQFLKDGGTSGLHGSIRWNYDSRVAIRLISREIVKEGQFKDLGNGVILIERSDGMHFQTIPFPLLFREYGIYCTVVIIASAHSDDKYKFNVRCGLDFPKETNLQNLAERQGLNRFGYGGRAHAGGNDRNLNRPETMTIKPEEFGKLFVEYLETVTN